MKTLKEFDYDLWTTEENGKKRYFARVKATGEETEISLELMRVLMNEEKKMRRELNSRKDGNGDLLLDVLPNDETGESWLVDKDFDIEDKVLSKFIQEDFSKLLTPNQAKIFKICMMGGMTIREYARRNGVDHKSVCETVEAIRKKSKKYFS